MRSEDREWPPKKNLLTLSLSPYFRRNFRRSRGRQPRVAAPFASLAHPHSIGLVFKIATVAVDEGGQTQQSPRLRQSPPFSAGRFGSLNRSGSRQTGEELTFGSPAGSAGLRNR